MAIIGTAKEQGRIIADNPPVQMTVNCLRRESTLATIESITALMTVA